MKYRILLIATYIVLTGFTAFSQDNPAKWTFETKKTGARQYDLIFTATVSNPWHIYSQSTPDGGPLPTAIRFNKNPLVTLSGPATEKGVLQQKYEEVFGVNVKFYNGKVVFVQQVNVKGTAKTSMKGTIEFMLCTDEQCLPPTEIPFSFKMD